MSSLTRSDLEPYQEASVTWIKEKESCAIWASMGLGKSISALTAIQDLINDFEIRRVLIIAPLRVARKTWTDEIDKWSHVSGLRIAKILGNEKQRLKGMRTRSDVYLVNRENVKWLVAQHFNVIEKPDPLSFRGRTIKKMGSKQIRPWIWDTVVIDESTSFKNQDSQRFSALRRVRKLFDRCIQLTGTPSPNGFMDLWAQIYLLDKGKRLGATLTAYRDRWFEPPGHNQFKWELKTMTEIDTHGNLTVRHWAKEQITDALKDICFALREEDYLDLPPVMYKTQKAYLTKPELMNYREMEKKFVLEIAGEVITAVNMGVLANKLLQLANGFIFSEHPRWIDFHNAKLDVLEELLDVATGPVIVVYSYVPDFQRIKQRLTELKINWRKLDSEQDEADWNDGKVDVLILHPESAGHGLNLHYSGSELLIWYGLTFNLEHYQQAIARLAGGHRRKNRNIVVQHIVAEGTRDQRVMDVLTEKDVTQAELVGAMRQIISEVKNER